MTRHHFLAGGGPILGTLRRDGGERGKSCSKAARKGKPRAGSGLDRVLKTTCFLAVPEAFDQLNTLYAEYFPAAPPARSTPVVQLPRGLLFSIEAIAAADPDVGTAPC